MKSCTVTDCKNEVQNQSHKLCYEHWKEQNGRTQPTPRLPEIVQSSASPELLSATKLGEKLGLSKNKVNPLLTELGLLDKTSSGWVATKLGLAFGAEQKLNSRKDNQQYVVWSENILSNEVFIKTIEGMNSGNSLPSATEDSNNFREKFLSEAKYRTDDGHMVRSKAEVLIDNWLYWADVAHAYERKLPIAEEVYCDFYIRTGKIYIEYWGYENNSKYTARKQEKQRLYEAHKLNLIELTDEHIKHLDDHLPRMLLKYGVSVS